MADGGSTAWTSPSNLLTVAALGIGVLGSYLALQRSNETDIRDLDRRITRVESRYDADAVERTERRRRLEDQLQDIRNRLDRARR